MHNACIGGLGNTSSLPIVMINVVFENTPFWALGMQRSRAWCGTPPILGVVDMVGTRNFTCYMGAL